MHPKFKFQNGRRIWKYSLKQSCRVWKVEQLLFLEIFNFFRKFESNLQNELGGNSVISQNSSRPPPHRRRPFSGLPGASATALGFALARGARCVSISRAPGRAIRPRRRRSRFFFLSVFPTPPSQLRRASLVSSAQASPGLCIKPLPCLLWKVYHLCYLLH